MKKFIFIFICFTVNIALTAFSQERQDEVRAKIEIKMLEQSERLSHVPGWSRIETQEGKSWRQSNVNSANSYLPRDPDESFDYFQIFKFKLEGGIYYILTIKYDEGRMRSFAFTSSSLKRLKNIVNTANGQPYYSIDIKNCEYHIVKDDGPFDPGKEITNKETIRLLLTGKGSNLLSNFCDKDSLFLVNSQMLKGDTIVRFNVIPWNNSSFVNNEMILSLTDNYFEIKKHDFEKLFRFTPYGDVNDFINQGNEKLKLKDYTGALSEFAKAININPDNWRYYNLCGQAKDGLKDYSGATDEYSKALEILSKENKSDGSIKQSIGILYGNRANSKDNFKDYNGAIADYSLAIENIYNIPDVPQYYYYRGNVKLKLKDFSGAESDFSEAIRHVPFGTENDNEKAAYFLARGNAKVALKDYAPKNLETLSGPEKATLKRNGNGAISDFSESIGLYPKNVSAYNMRAISKNAIQDYNGAMSDCNKAIEIDPNFAAAYCNRAKVKNNLQDYSGAIIDSDKALEISPNIGAAFNHRGLAKIKLGQKEDGCIDLNKAAKLGYPDSNDLINQYCK